MKKIIVSLLFLLIPLVCFGQIKRNIDGVILGKSTKQEIVSYLKSRKIPYSMGKVGIYNTVICNTPRAFAGISWSSTYYILYNNVVFKISYSNSDYDMLKEEIDLSFENLSMALQHKYSQFKRADRDRDKLIFRDANVEITLSRDFLENHYMFGIDYSDLKLMEKAFMEGDDDL